MCPFKKDIRNILVFRNDRFGEFLLNIPVLRALKESFRDIKIIAIINPYVKELAECVPFIDTIIEWEQKKHSLLEKFKFINLLKSKKIDIAIMLNPSKESNILTYLSGIPLRIGYARKWGFLLTHKIKDKKYLSEKHEVEYNLDLAGSLGATTQDKTLSLNINSYIITNLLKEFSIEESDKLIAVHPFTSDPIKQWPLRNFTQLCKELVKGLNTKVIIIGGKDELSKGAEFLNLDANIISLIGKTSLTQLAAFFKRCRLLISGDSGPVHLACAIGIPVIAIFRNDILGKSSKRWGPVSEASIVVEKNNLEDITVEEVLAKTRSLIK